MRRTRLIRPTGVPRGISSASATSSGALVRSTLRRLSPGVPPTERMSSVKDRIEFEPAPDQPVLVTDEGADAMLDVDQSFANQNSQGLSKRRPADFKVLSERDFAHQACAGLQLA